MNKKAISPLISTFVLIVFAAVLGAVVISWGTSHAQIIEGEKGCEEVILEAVTISNAPQVCYTGNQLEFTLENKGDVDIGGLRILIIGEDGITKAETAITILIADANRGRSVFSNVGIIKKVILIPKVVQNKAEVICSKNSVGIENIGAC